MVYQNTTVMRANLKSVYEAVMREVRIALVGEKNVGKTTLILGLVSEEFSLKVPIKAEEITIPADVNQERVPSRIVDTSSREQSEQQIREEIRAANVIIIVYAVNDPLSIRMVSEKWLPLIRECNPSKHVVDRVPVVLAGNKSDLAERNTLDQILGIMNTYPEIETCIECSALNMQNVSEMFWYAQKAVLYPTAPLFVAEKKDLTDAAKKALTRIFRICDMDNDGYLSDKELESFQRRCFQIPLSNQSLEDIKYMVGKNTLDGITANGLTLKGFLFLNSMFIRKGRHETTWAVLRCFGYDNRLRLSRDYVSPQFTVPTGCSTELSSHSVAYLEVMFRKYDEDRDGCLSPQELQNLFLIAPQLPWDNRANNSVHCNTLGFLTLEGFISQWVLMTYFSPRTTLEYLAYLGFTYEYGLSPSSNGADRGGASTIPASTSTYGLGMPVSVTHEQQQQFLHYRQHQANVALAEALASHSSPSHSLESDIGGPSSSYATDLLADEGQSLHSQHATGLRPSSSSSLGSAAAPPLLQSSRSNAWSSHQHWLVQTALTVTREKRLDLHKKQSMRNVFYCRVYGASKVGKTCFLQGLLGRSLNYAAQRRREELPQFTCAPVIVYGELKHLILHEVDDAWGLQMTDEEALTCDVAALLYDVTDPHSFKYVADLYLNYYKACHRRVPCIFIACKAEQMEVTQYYPLDPAEFCAKHRLPLGDPLKFSCMNPPTNSSSSGLGAGIRVRAATPGPTNETGLQDGLSAAEGDRGSGAGCLPDYAGTALRRHEIYQQLTTLANFPHLRGLQLSQNDFAWKLTIAATVLAGFGFVAFKMARTHM